MLMMRGIAKNRFFDGNEALTIIENYRFIFYFLFKPVNGTETHCYQMMRSALIGTAEKSTTTDANIISSCWLSFNLFALL